MKTEIYLAHALTNAPEEFRRRMLALRENINQIPDVAVLEFNWKPGHGPDTSINTFDHDMAMVNRAALMVAICDHLAFGVGMEIVERCRILKPLRCFVSHGVRLTQIVPDCMASFRATAPKPPDFADPIVYVNDDDILLAIVDWVGINPPAL